jgi:hypothetical protein
VPSRARCGAVASSVGAVLAVVVIAITAALSVFLLVSTEYGAPIFPPLWGILASLPPAAGVLAVVLLFRPQQGDVATEQASVAHGGR